MLDKKSFFSSFSFAFRGIKDALKSEPNLRIHFSIALVVAFGAFYFKFSLIEWAILTLTITSVITLEFINTILEKIVDIVSPEKQEKARIAKDISAAVVLLGALASVVIGLILFLPKIF